MPSVTWRRYRTDTSDDDILAPLTLSSIIFRKFHCDFKNNGCLRACRFARPRSIDCNSCVTRVTRNEVENTNIAASDGKKGRNSVFVHTELRLYTLWWWIYFSDDPHENDRISGSISAWARCMSWISKKERGKSVLEFTILNFDSPSTWLT